MSSFSLPAGVNPNLVPAMPPPPGVQSNLVDPPSLFPALVAVNVIMILWSTSFVIMRLIVKGRAIGLGDCCCVFGLLLSLTYTALCFEMPYMTRHGWDAPLAWLLQPDFMKIGFTVGLLSGPGAFFAKMSIFILYLQVFKVSTVLRVAIYFGMVLNTIIYWPFVIVTSYECAPDLQPGPHPDSKCPLLYPYIIAQGAAIIALDLYIFLLPLPTLLRLRLSAAKKVAAFAVFMTASLGIVASICAEAFRILELDINVGGWTQGQLSICIIVENYVSVLVSCAPAVSQFTNRYVIPTTFGQYMRSKVLYRLGISPSPSAEKPQISPLDLEAARNQPGHSKPEAIVFERVHADEDSPASSDKQGDSSDRNSDRESNDGIYFSTHR